MFCAGGASGSAADLIEKAKKAERELQNGQMRKVDELLWGRPEDVTTDVANGVLKEAAQSFGNVVLIAKEIKALAAVKSIEAARSDHNSGAQRGCEDHVALSLVRSNARRGDELDGQRNKKTISS